MATAKAEIIARIVNDAVCCRSSTEDVSSDEAGYSEEEIVAVLEVSLKNASPDEQVRTCEDFIHQGMACCDTCHNFDPQFEMTLIDIESGGHAWICCAVDRALNPQKHSERESSPEWKEIFKMFDGEVVDPEHILESGLSDLGIAEPDVLQRGSRASV